ncbi:MAG: gliding motility-associated C-terminal domain-containing protein, partial [Bacteroidetes bacterium]|nr:gliding motility-associated C-terminal domain-containing protein [Bacteroidota bacterium]
MKKVLKSSFIILSFLLILSKGWATHIVGGEFEIIHLKDFDYQLNLVQYFDVVNGNPFAEDSTVVAFIFRKTDNQFIRSVKLLRVDRELVGYTQ